MKEDSLRSGTLQDGEGFLLLSIGDDRKQMLFNLIESINSNYPLAPIHVLTDSPVDVSYTLIPSLSDHESRSVKTRLFHFSPFEVTIFLDDDTILQRPFGDLSSLLGKNDLAMALDPMPNFGRFKSLYQSRGGFGLRSWARFASWITPDLYDNPYYNSGVMIWRKTPRIEAIFNEWHSLWKGEREIDQVWLAIALTNNRDVRVTILDQRMNRGAVCGNNWYHGIVLPPINECYIIHGMGPAGKKAICAMMEFPAPTHRKYIESKRYGVTELREDVILNLRYCELEDNK